MKRIFFAIGFAFLFLVAASAQEHPLWLRHCAISPDGSTIAFTYKGDIFTVPVSGGRASQMTVNPAYDTQPVWSPDSRSLVFSSNREGSFDLFLVGKEGGVPRRLTTHSAAEYPETFLNNDEVLYTAIMMPESGYGEFPSGQFQQVYKVSVNGGRPELYSSQYMEDISIDKTGKKLLYNDKKGYEDKWRKHHQSSITRDIWLTDASASRQYKQMTTFRGEDRNPVWAADGDHYYYLSEQDGSFNVYQSSVTHPAEVKQMTKHRVNPVRFLTLSTNQLLCYSLDGEIYTLKEGESPKKIEITVMTDNLDRNRIAQQLTGGATALSVSPGGKEVAFVVRGDVYVTSVDYETTRRITNTPEQERDVEFSPDGRSIVYSSERGGVWGIYKTEIARKEDTYFIYAAEINEEPLVCSALASFEPKFSPDGKEVAFLESRTTLRVVDLKSKKIRTVLDGKYNYSYTDGDQSFEWSPDGKWLLAKYISVGGWNNTDIALIKADGSGEVVNLTESGYADANPKWVLDGKAMIWSSDRAGYRSHGSWGAQRDEYLMFFDAEAYDKFRMNKEELALYEEVEKIRKEEEKTKKEKVDENTKNPDRKSGEKLDNSGADKPVEKSEKGEIKALTFDLDNRKDRIIRLTTHSTFLGDAALTPKGDKLYYLTSFEGGVDLWERNFRERSDKIIVKGAGFGQLMPDKEAKYIYMLSGGALKRIEMSSNAVKAISFRADFDYKPMQERGYIFEHAWQQVKDKFYTADLHGIEWNLYKKVYEKFLPHINNNFDFAELLSELLGELNGSHTGARYGVASSYQTAALGAFFDNGYEGDGLRIKEVIKKGPLTQAKTKVKDGVILEKIDGFEIRKGEDYNPLLENKAGKKLLLSFIDPKTKERFEERITPVTQGAQQELLYMRWVERRRALVDSLSQGRIGYVHIKGMNSDSFRETYSEVLGRCRNKEAILVDTRHNGGGWLHDDLVTLLSGKEYQQFAPRGQYIGSDPFNKWTKPSAVLVCEDNYSNAHGFPYVYKTLGIGKLIGAPVPGTMTAVWWETQIDPSLVFGVPQVGVRDMNGKFLENQELEPDIEVYNDPASLNAGRDIQLEKGVAHLLDVVGKSAKK